MSILIALLLGAASLEQTFDDASHSYADDQYLDAVMKYEELVFRGVQEPEVFFNLGNAYYRSGYLSPAIANYERALLLEPTLEAAQDNLIRSVSQTKRGLSRPQPPAWEQALLFWHFNLNRQSVAAATLLFWSAAWILLVIRRFKSIPYLRRSAVVCLVIALASGTSWWVKAHQEVLAVAAVDNIPVHYGNTLEDTVRFELFEGDRVLIEARTEGWLRIRTPDEERGWVQTQFMISVGPPFGSPTVKLSSEFDTADDKINQNSLTREARINDNPGL
ncbi:MAG: hypothetical protein COA73_03870 [Candidatus Hydrogenedentota bacterium]|nr:MAG: hypothetical protein COA73_04795 [Candidatus Hydrogenedentota bacterium]PCJ64476.1 MAG: hypothetical protein COA73_03870 [Candidatus Hydrogenedentota bacterium]